MKPTESKSVQQRIITYATELGWKYVPRLESDSRRGGTDSYKSELFYREILSTKLLEFNPWLPAGYSLPIPPSRIEGNRQILLSLRGQSTAYDEQEKRERNVTVIDFVHPERNVFEVTDEFSVSNGRYSNRQDIVFLINGIPIIDLECKNLTTAGGIDKALDQIRRYHRESPELLIVEQAYLASEGMRLEYGVTWNTLRRNIFTWKGDKIGELENKVKTFFNISHILNLIEKYIMFIEKDEQISKLVLREHQANAVEVIFPCMTFVMSVEATIYKYEPTSQTFPA
jgi:type I restriction enzyme R subunit